MTTTVVEEWRPIAGYEGLYEVSDMGRVRSLSHEVRCGPQGRYRRTTRGRVLRTNKVGTRLDYRQVKLPKDSIQEQKLVHQLVAIAFIGLAPSAEHEVCHTEGAWNGDALSNIRWGTHKENGADMKRHRQERTS